MKVTVFGTGYVGLTQAACLAEVGHSVCCVDVDERRVASLLQGHGPVFEPGLPALLEKKLASGRLKFTTDAALATAFADTEWQDFRVLDLEQVPQMLADRVVFDGRNLFEPEHMAAAGLAYYGIGRGRVDSE